MKIINGLVADRDFNFRPEDIYIQGECFTEPYGDSDDDSFDASGYIVLPGLVNAHYHSNEILLKGYNDMHPLEFWALYFYPFPNPVVLSPEQAYLRTLYSAAELLLNGTTTVIDHIYDPNLSQGNLAAIIQAYMDAGLRAVICPGIADIGLEESFSGVEGLKRDMPDAAGILKNCSNYLKDHRKHDMVELGLGPSRHQRCSDELLYGVSKLSNQYDAVIHAHLLETKYQAIISSNRSVEKLKKHKLSSHRSSFAHCIWTNRSENEYLASTGATVVHNPVSNLRLGSGIAKIGRMLEMGIDVALGTDGACSCETASILDAARTACLISRVGPHKAVQTVEALKMATISGAKAAGQKETLGAIEPGQKADLILIKRSLLPFVPEDRLPNWIVFDRPKIDHVMINGEWSVFNGQLCKIDLIDLREKVTDLRLGYEDKIKRSVENADRIKEKVEPWYFRVMES